MNYKRIEEIHKESGYSDSVLIKKALIKVWYECDSKPTWFKLAIPTMLVVGFATGAIYTISIVGVWSCVF